MAEQKAVQWAELTEVKSVDLWAVQRDDPWVES